MSGSVYITVDVECSMGGAWGNARLRPVPPARAIMGEYDGQSLGLPLICDILTEHGLAATHFVEAFTDEQGFPGEMERISHYLLDRGQDVQLHVHPNHKHYADMLAGRPFVQCDQMADLPPEAQYELLAEGARRMEAWTGRPCAAFRAGNMGASEQTLEQMALVGIPIDSSYTFCYLGGQCRFQDRQAYNGSKWYGSVLELGLSGFRQRRLPGLKPAKPLDLVGISFEECRDGVRAICDAGADAVVILHSFSLMKVRNMQYDGGRLNRIVSRRLQRLCAWLAAEACRYPVRTFADLAERLAWKEYDPKGVEPFTMRRPLRALARKGVQFYNGFYST